MIMNISWNFFFVRKMIVVGVLYYGKWRKYVTVKIDAQNALLQMITNISLIFNSNGGILCIMGNGK